MATIEASWTALTAILDAITLGPNAPALMLAAVRFVKLAPLTTGSWAEPLSLTRRLAPLNVASFAS